VSALPVGGKHRLVTVAPRGLHVAERPAPRCREVGGRKTTTLPARRVAEPATPARSAEAPGFTDKAALLRDLRTLVQAARQRTALSKKPESVISAEIGKLREGQMSRDTVVRDPYLLELGAGFTFVARKKTHERWQGRLLPRPAVLPPTPAPADRRRAEARIVRPLGKRLYTLHSARDIDAVSVRAQAPSDRPMIIAKTQRFIEFSRDSLTRQAGTRQV
jgi:hypothetical protein